MSCSEGDSKPALGEGPKVFMLAEAISDIRKHPLLGNPVRALRVPWPETVFYFLLLLL
jgi:hypothetical protein